MLMFQATDNLRIGKIPEADAIDVRAGTVLDSLSVEEEDKLGRGFLGHPKLHMTVKGHLVWTLQRSTGMRGDDLRSMHLAALQLYNMALPNDFSNQEVPVLVLLQCNHKTVHRTNIELPKFHTGITHQRPELDAQAALGFYLHWLFDAFQIEDKHEFDWTLNNRRDTLMLSIVSRVHLRWVQPRLIFGSSCDAEYSEGSFYNLFSRSYQIANVPIKHKSSLQRHLLGKHHEGQGVAQSETERMGWASGVYAKHYAKSIPKQAVLGSAGFHRAEKYNPIGIDNVKAPEHLVKKLFLQAEARIEVIEKAIVEGNAQLRGARNFWKLVAGLRCRILLAGAAIFSQSPESALFRLPIFQDPDVLVWMRDAFPAEMDHAIRNAGQVDPEMFSLKSSQKRCMPRMRDSMHFGEMWQHYWS